MRFLILDTETTGFVPKVHRVMEVACMVMDDRVVRTEVEHLLSLPPGVEIPVAIQRLTHIAPEDLVGKPTFAEILPELQKLLTPETILVGQNIPFDLGMLRGEGWDLTEHPWIDTSMLASIVFPELESYSLGFVSDVLGLTHTPRHRALGDVRATSELLLRCIDRLESLSVDRVAELRTIAARGPEGYRRFFEGLNARGTDLPSWLHPSQESTRRAAEPIKLMPPTEGGVHLVEESLNGGVTEGVLHGMPEHTWLAVKNIEAMTERLSIPHDVVILVPPEFLLSARRRDALQIGRAHV